MLPVPGIMAMFTSFQMKLNFGNTAMGLLYFFQNQVMFLLDHHLDAQPPCFSYKGYLAD